MGAQGALLLPRCLNQLSRGAWVCHEDMLAVGLNRASVRNSDAAQRARVPWTVGLEASSSEGAGAWVAESAGAPAPPPPTVPPSPKLYPGCLRL